LINHRLNEIVSVVDNAYSKLENNEKDECQKLIEYANDSLKSDKNILTVFINHDLYDELSDSLTSMLIYSDTDKTEFLKEYAILKERIDSIIEHESINIKGVF